MSRKVFDISEDTIDRIQRCQRLVAKDLGLKRLSKTAIVELAVASFYKQHQWREDNDASND